MTPTEFDQQEIIQRLAMLAAHCRHVQVFDAEAGRKRCADCGSIRDVERSQVERSERIAQIAAPRAPLAEDAVRRVRDAVEPAGWSRIDPANHCASCFKPNGTGHRADCQNPDVLRERAVEWSVRDNRNGPHTPADHGNEFWSSGCTAPVCVAERQRIYGRSLTLSAGDANRLRQLVMEYKQRDILNWNRLAIQTLCEVLNIELR